jgi:hydroxymethylpyrimidine/phosphomethylpyrimidine kinase
MKPAKVLCIGGSDSSGGAGIQADLKTVHACGCYGLTVITALTAQNSLGVQDIFAIESAFVEKQMESVLSDIGADAVKTGMLFRVEVVEVIAKKIKKYGLEKVVIDPVMIAKGGRTLMQDKEKKALIKKLLPLALVVTPNIPEAEYLARMNIRSIEEMKEAAVNIHKLGAKNVIIKGGHLQENKKKISADILYDGMKYYNFSSEWINTKNTHGTGCTFASALAAGLAQGENIIDAAQGAKIIVTSAIKNSLSLGRGNKMANA